MENLPIISLSSHFLCVIFLTSVSSFLPFCACVCLCVCLCVQRSFRVLSIQNHSITDEFTLHIVPICVSHTFFTRFWSTFLLFVTGKKGVFVCFSLIKGRVVVCFVCIFLFFFFLLLFHNNNYIIPLRMLAETLHKKIINGTV